MQKRHTLHGAVPRPSTQVRLVPSQPPTESGTRIRNARSSEGVDDNVQASIDFAMAELDNLEMPYRASAPPLTVSPAQQMPRGMPPLPFQAPHPHNMPPLPVAVPALPASSPSNDVRTTAALSPTPDVAAAADVARPSRWWLFVALAMGAVCLGGALWLQLH